MNELELKNQLQEMKEKNNRMLKFLEMFEADMNFDCNTDLEMNLKDQMNDIFKYMHKNYKREGV